MSWTWVLKIESYKFEFAKRKARDSNVIERKDLQKVFVLVFQRQKQGSLRTYHY